MWSSRSSKEQKREEESSHDTTMEMKHNKTRAPDHDNRLVVHQAKSTNREQLVISTNMAAPNRNLSCLPPEIVQEIVDLLPIKSINRFRSISKSLFSLLAIKFKVQKLLYYPCIRDFPPSNCGRESRLVSDYSTGRRLYYSFMGSCNGLVCLDVIFSSSKPPETFVWNPFTGICRKLPRKDYYAYGFGYDSASDDYKVFAATAPHPAKVEIFSLKSGSWKEVENLDREYLQHIPGLGCTGLFLNGALHWRPRESYREEKSEIIAIAFDLDKEKFYHVPSPPNHLISRRSPGFGVVGEYLCCFHSEYFTNIIWVMKEYGNDASWVPFISYTEYGKLDGRLTYACDFIPRSFKDGRYMMLQFAWPAGMIHVLHWNNILEESEEAEEYSKKIEFYSVPWGQALPYTQTLTSPYAS
ncbi:hypothetical protein Tsubulata_005129 [Turnera subulata]|uniref:F-box domain-containing protein n=1 Tax=Turnera subulata TaxID=218843 RepID=A0A9Q0JBR0_9ROSI|nr:hypothetical protein Tsubulata_005129 [Turnera subulata]